MANKLPTVPWTSLFPGLNHSEDIIRDSTRRKNGERHYRVKLRLPHTQLARVQALLAPYGFHVTTDSWAAHHMMLRLPMQQGIKCIRHTSGA